MNRKSRRKEARKKSVSQQSEQSYPSQLIDESKAKRRAAFQKKVQDFEAREERRSHRSQLCSSSGEEEPSEDTNEFIENEQSKDAEAADRPNPLLTEEEKEAKRINDARVKSKTRWTLFKSFRDFVWLQLITYIINEGSQPQAVNNYLLEIYNVECFCSYAQFFLLYMRLDANTKSLTLHQHWQIIWALRTAAICIVSFRMLQSTDKVSVQVNLGPDSIERRFEMITTHDYLKNRNRMYLIETKTRMQAIISYYIAKYVEFNALLSGVILTVLCILTNVFGENFEEMLSKFFELDAPEQRAEVWQGLKTFWDKFTEFFSLVGHLYSCPPDCCPRRAARPETKKTFTYLPVQIIKRIIYPAPACLVCEVPYDDSDTEVELPCDSAGNHTMHEHCAFFWTEYFSKCPACNQEVLKPKSDKTKLPERLTPHKNEYKEGFFEPYFRNKSKPLEKWPRRSTYWPSKIPEIRELHE